MRWILLLFLFACEAETGLAVAEPDAATDAAAVEADVVEADALEADAIGPDMRPVDAAPPDAGPTCPPAEPHGVTVGQRIPALALPDCDGTLHDLHDLCGEVGFFFYFAAWCPPCRRFGNEFNDFWAEFSGASAFVILSADENFAAPDAADCRRIRDQYELVVPVLYDAEGVVAERFGVPSNDMAFVTDREGTLRFIEHYSTRDQKEAALREALAH